ncbi:MULTISPECIES: HD domain-containing protein [unclassified Sphingobium]|uniref:HD domain-containing protein n=1 Tax=unclassified Sphingobium TaxID=2611147 RepID=UPI00222417F4|nr:MULTISPECIES: HD domain-containing protein [unclassified Sphingobium]MCW2410726.1 phosphonate degradation associated HDIG domain protein [Sphingobium sp. B8D3D]MCW2416984.1 phosphonate degradation associated HDIG domain protein [Sphingobium sp. B8D3A]
MIDQIRMMFDRFGREYYGENATQLAHALQCACLARRDGRTDSLVAAALLHDIGQFIDDAGHAAEQLNVDARHEVTGAAFLAQWFGPAVTEPVRMHVDAKRYLCAVERGYTEGLSDASVLSLRLQGGPMVVDEANRFAAEHFFEDSIHLRRYDDAGKQPGLLVPPLESYFPLLESLAAARK